MVVILGLEEFSFSLLLFLYFTILISLGITFG